MTCTAPPLRRFRVRPVPEIVPPVPIGATKCVTAPSASRQISGAVLSTCARGFEGLSNCVASQAPGVASTNPLACECALRGCDFGRYPETSRSSAPYAVRMRRFSSAMNAEVKITDL